MSLLFTSSMQWSLSVIYLVLGTVQSLDPCGSHDTYQLVHCSWDYLRLLEQRSERENIFSLGCSIRQTSKITSRLYEVCSFMWYEVFLHSQWAGGVGSSLAWLLAVMQVHLLQPQWSSVRWCCWCFSRTSTDFVPGTVPHCTVTEVARWEVKDTVLCFQAWSHQDWYLLMNFL